jgi:response regulator RpfG family c-di-GMP phosphodiesterase
MTSLNPHEMVAVDERRQDGADSKAGAKRTVLCVDDEPGILSALKRALRAPDIAVLTATSGAQALQIMAELPVDLIISDMRMPGMDGAQVLERACLEWPDTVRVLLTGHADTAATILAVNRGRIFRYLQKPWDDDELVESVHEGLALRRRLQAEARLLSMGAAQEQQLRQLTEDLRQLQKQHAADRRSSDAARQRRYLQSVKVLTNLLEVRSSALFRHGRRVAALARDIAKEMALPSEATLDVFVAGLLHDLGLIGLSDELLARLDGGGTSAEDALYRDHSLLSARALAPMEDMLPVARVVEAHHERFDGTGFPFGSAGDAIPLGARILALADAADDLAQGRSGLSACEPAALAAWVSAESGRHFDPAVVEAWVRLNQPQ